MKMRGIGSGFAQSLLFHGGLFALAFFAMRGVRDSGRGGAVSMVGTFEPSAPQALSARRTEPSATRPTELPEAKARGGNPVGTRRAFVQTNTSGGASAGSVSVGNVGPPFGGASSLTIHPRYPRASRALGEEGSVLLHAHFSPNGVVSEIRLLRSSGFRRLDEAALEAARGASTSPPTPTDVDKDFTVVFRLSNPDSE